MSGSARRAIVGLLGVVGLTLAAACSTGRPATAPARSPGDASPAQGTSPASADSVTIRLVAFGPPTLEVDRGATVTWTQADKGAVHTVTSGTVDTDVTGATTARADGTFDSGQLAEGGRFAFTFSQPGTYPYFCVIHQATMRGEVRVR